MQSGTSTPPLEPAGQDWRAERYAAHARFVADLGMPVLELLAPRAGERVLDLGCGDGVLTAKLAGLGCAAVGVDAGPDMVRAARALGVDARVMDGHALAFEREFDAVFSNAALHWMKADPDAVIAGVARALRPGGRFVAEMGGQGNVAAITEALVAALNRRGLDGAAAIPWYFPTPAEYGAKLERHGFEVRRIELLPRPTPLAKGMAAWLETFGEPFLQRLAPAERPPFTAEVVELLRPVLRDGAGYWTADYVRLRFAAVLHH
ncbi:MAG TPA: methyltransferase domain-containing protein [Geminicoccaceae bacterium]|nr:methyltransferase domain-containing protein [Geminicoccaceae bacterium]